MALFSSRDSNYDIHRDIEALRREIAALSRTASKRGSAALRGAADEASGLYDDVAERFNNALPVIRRRARDIEETIRDNPTRSAAVIGLAALTVAAMAFLMSHRR
jgi:ABC-type transporter Mla subunit MlaD